MILHLESSPFVPQGPHPLQATHVASWWQADLLGGDFSAPVFDSGWDTVNLLSIDTPDLPFDTYIFRVAHQDGLEIESAWSEPVAAGACAEGFRLTFFESDDTTPIFGLAESGVVLEGSFHTGASCARPFMLVPETISESEVDFPEGRSVIGGMTVRVLDKRTDPADQATGIGTSILDLLPDARALVEQWNDSAADWVTVFEGVVKRTSTVQGEFVIYEFELRDIRERERNLRLFATNGSYSIYPPGPLSGYGLLPDGSYQVAAAEVQAGVFHFVRDDSTPGFPITPGHSNGYLSVASNPSVSAEAIEAGRPVPLQGGSFAYGYPNVTVRWRPAGGGAWTNLTNMVADYALPSNLFSAFSYTPELATGNVGINRDPFIYMEGLEADMPADLADIEVQVLSRAVPSEDAPFYYEGTFGLLLKNIYDGVYSEPTRVRYDAARMAELVTNTPIARLRITESVDNAKAWVEENIYKPLGLAPVLNAIGEVSPIAYALPDSGVTLLELDDDNVQADASWELDTDDKISAVEFEYIREYVGADGEVVERPITVVHRAIGVISERTLKYKPVTTRAIGGVDGQPVTADQSSETGAQLAAARANDVLQRFSNGAQRISLTARGSDAAVLGIRPGNWRRVRLSWLPDTATGVRGTDRVMQVIKLKRRTDGWVELGMLDGGDYAAGLALPTVGPLSYDTLGRVAIPVTVVPAGTTARIEYAVSTLEPAADSPLWMYVGSTDVPATLTTPQVVSDSTVWVRFRSEQAPKRPSPWGTSLSIAPSGFPRIVSASLTVDTLYSAPEGGTVTGTMLTVFAEGNADTLGLRFTWDNGTQTLDIAGPSQVVVLSLAAPLTSPGDYVEVTVEPWSGWTGSAVDGSAGPVVVLSRGIATGESGIPLITAALVTTAIPLTDGELQVFTALGAFRYIPLTSLYELPHTTAASVRNDIPATV